MTEIFVLLAFGLAVGRIARGVSGMGRSADRLMMAAVWVLLFLLGHSLGQGGTFLQGLGRLGGHALLLAAATILGSSVCASILARWWKPRVE